MPLGSVATTERCPPPIKPRLCQCHTLELRRCARTLPSVDPTCQSSTSCPCLKVVKGVLPHCELAEQLGGDAVAQVVERVRHAVAVGVLEHAVDGDQCGRDNVGPRGG